MEFLKFLHCILGTGPGKRSGDVESGARGGDGLAPAEPPKPASVATLRQELGTSRSEAVSLKVRVTRGTPRLVCKRMSG